MENIGKTLMVLAVGLVILFLFFAGARRLLADRDDRRLDRRRLFWPSCSRSTCIASTTRWRTGEEATCTARSTCSASAAGSSPGPPARIVYAAACSVGAGRRVRPGARELWRGDVEVVRRTTSARTRRCHPAHRKREQRAAGSSGRRAGYAASTRTSNGARPRRRRSRGARPRGIAALDDRAQLAAAARSRSRRRCGSPQR